MLAPTLFAHGTQEQLARILPKMASGEEIWAQAWSEPESGSDLASLRSTATKVDGGWKLNGQKIWTAWGHHSQWMFALVRTDPNAQPRHAGISFILLDLKSPGIRIRPIHTIAGDDEFAEVFFDNVKVPAKHLVGEENKGWTYAKFLLGNERTGVAGVGLIKTRIAHVKRLAAEGKTFASLASEKSKAA